MIIVRAFLAALFVAWLSAPALAQDSQASWDALAQGGHVMLIRHANAPGLGDPPGVRADECKTQRNLDDVGRAQAKELGDAFRARGVRVGRVVSSPWCRCLDTATLMALGKVETSTSLLSDRAGKNPERRTELKQMIATSRGPGTLVLVSHGWAIEALFGFIPASAETLVIKPRSASNSGGDLVGRIAAPPGRTAAPGGRT
jgi:phosphohistidine phosphatase SixA